MRLVPPGSTQDREYFRRNEDFDAARDTRLSPDQPGSFEGQHHLVDRGRADAEMPLKVSFGRRPAEDARICINEGQILTLLGRERWNGGRG